MCIGGEVFECRMDKKLETRTRAQNMNFRGMFGDVGASGDVEMFGNRGKRYEQLPGFEICLF